MPQLDDLSLDLSLDLDFDLTTGTEGTIDLMTGYEYTGDAEVDSKAEMSAVLTEFKSRAKAEEARRAKATDSEYWFCVCFQSRAQVEEFLRKSGWAKPDQKYLDGQKLATKLNVPLTPETIPFRKLKKPTPRLAKLAMEVTSK